MDWSKGISRRGFVGSWLGTTAGPVMDAHTHFYDPARPEGVPWPPRGEKLLYRRVLPGEFVALSRPHGVTAAIVVEASAWLEDNQWLLDLASEQRVIAGVVGHLNPGEDGFGMHLARFRRNALFLGIRVGGAALGRGLERRAFVEDLRRLAGEGLALDVLGDAGMLMDVARLMKVAPGLRVVVDHLPFEGPGGEALAALGEYGGVYAKVSGRTTDRAGLDELWRVFGAERLMYASNWPVSERVAPYGRIFATVHGYFAGKGAEALRRFEWENAQAAYRWAARR